MLVCVCTQRNARLLLHQDARTLLTLFEVPLILGAFYKLTDFPLHACYLDILLPFRMPPSQTLDRTPTFRLPAINCPSTAAYGDDGMRSGEMEVWEVDFCGHVFWGGGRSGQGEGECAVSEVESVF